jgi:hypothetical protein
VIGIFTKAADNFGKYGSVPSAGHSLGIAMLILVGLTAAAIGAAYAGAVGTEPALMLAAITLGLTVFLPVQAAFNDFGHLEVGGWLAGFGGIALLLGVVAMRRMAAVSAPMPAVTEPPRTPA